ncbi:MAG: hypothetical protein UZ05_CHB002001822 [Chlorobi bacterium OLB5]|nr:MAG: hypothetical protein UZ05_CHB002001822 [Chlorobi bacterium OLB5]
MPKIDPKELFVQIENKWENAYWFARMLISNDKYGSIGKDNKLLSTITGTLKVIAKENKGNSDLLLLQKQAIKNILSARFERAKALIQRVKKFVVDLDDLINDEVDMNVFILTCDNIMMPINQAIANIPSDDKEFTLAMAKTYLDIEKEKGLASVIKLWDDLGVKGCLTVERAEIVKAFAVLRILLNKNTNLNSKDTDIILTAFTQEFERRAAQKRKKQSWRKRRRCYIFYLRIL